MINTLNPNLCHAQCAGRLSYAPATSETATGSHLAAKKTLTLTLTSTLTLTLNLNPDLNPDLDPDLNPDPRSSKRLRKPATRSLHVQADAGGYCGGWGSVAKLLQTSGVFNVSQEQACNASRL